MYATMFKVTMRSNLRYAPIVYQLIDAAFIGKIFMIHSYFKIENLAMCDKLVTLGSEGLKRYLVRKIMQIFIIISEFFL